MAVSLVSTGVQFPDSSIQTTAASAGTSTLISTTSMAGASTLNLTGFTTSYRQYVLAITGLYATSRTFNLSMRLYNNGSLITSSAYNTFLSAYPGSPGGYNYSGDSFMRLTGDGEVPYSANLIPFSCEITFNNPASTANGTFSKWFVGWQSWGQLVNGGPLSNYGQFNGANIEGATITNITGLYIYNGSGTWAGGTAKLYGIS